MIPSSASSPDVRQPVSVGGGQRMRQVSPAARPCVPAVAAVIATPEARIAASAARTPWTGRRQRAGQDRWTSTVPERAREAVDVVGVEVREDDEIQRRDVPATETAVDAGRVRAGVDQHGSFGSAAQQHRVALADVALDHAPVLRRATADEEAWRDQPAEDHGQHEHPHRPREPAPGARTPP